jgi:hypothetical protein
MRKQLIPPGDGHRPWRLLKRGLLLLTWLAWGLMGNATAFADDHTIQRTFSGKGASGIWTTCPAQPPSEGITCHTASLTVSEQMTREDGTKTTNITLLFFQSNFFVDATGNFTLLSQYQGEGEASLTLSGNLAGATTRATIPILYCPVGGTCFPLTTATLTATWTGMGEVFITNTHFHTEAGGLRWRNHFHGKVRDALGSAQVNGTDWGTQVFAQLFQGTSTFLTICHQGC